jgi:hypothetical protein
MTPDLNPAMSPLRFLCAPALACALLTVAGPAAAGATSTRATATAGATATATTADDDPLRRANNVLYAEWLGPGQVYSIDYERTLDRVSLRAGVGYIPGIVKPSTPGAQGHFTTLLLTVPICVSYAALVSDWNVIEVAAGAVPMYVRAHVSTPYIKESDSNTTTVLGTLYFGYRYQPSSGGISVRAGISMLAGKYGFLPLWPYVSLGTTF